MQKKQILQFPEYEAHMRDEILALLGGKEHKRLIWDWQFGQAPFNRRATPVVAVDQGKIIGFNGMMPVDVIYSGSIVPAVWSCDFFVHPAYRGKGVGRRMKERLISQHQLIMSLGISDRASPLLLKMGWRPNPAVRRLTRIRDPQSLKEIALKSVQWVRSIGHSALRRSQVQLEMSSVLPPVDQIDRLWAQVGHSYGKAVCRTGRYLHWRYGLHPLAQYRFLRLEVDGCLVGISVLRDSGSVVRLVDYVGVLDRPFVLVELAMAMDWFFPRAHRQVCTTSNLTLQAALLRCGFLKTRARPRFYVKSTLDGDFDWENGWFIVSGDSDGDILDAARTTLLQGSALKTNTAWRQSA